ncbi:MAG: hypothetical protein Q9227_008660 [Pyrenula ochraceoflavens]
MADPLSITASIIPIVGAAVASVQVLSRTIDAIKDAPGILKETRSDLVTVTAVLQQLEKAGSERGSDNLMCDGIVPAVKNCDRACSAFNSKLELWTRHSSNKGGALADRLKIGMLCKERIQTLRAQLSNCKATLNLAISTATVISLTETEDDPDERALLLKQREQSLQQKIIRGEREEAAVEKSVQHFASIPESLEDVNEQSKQDLLEEVRYQRASNEIFCGIRGTRAKDYSKAAAGVINPTGREAKVHLDITDTCAENWSFAGAGIINNFDFNPMAQKRDQVFNAGSTAGKMRSTGTKSKVLSI